MDMSASHRVPNSTGNIHSAELNNYRATARYYITRPAIVAKSIIACIILFQYLLHLIVSRLSVVFRTESKECIVEGGKKSILSFSLKYPCDSVSKKKKVVFGMCLSILPVFHKVPYSL